MSEAKITIKVGHIEFTGEGEQGWLAAQLDKVLTQSKDLHHLSAPAAAVVQQENRNTNILDNGVDVAKKTLPSFLSEKSATTNQTKKFLATAVWLHAKGQNRLQAKDVASALKTANQTRLGNPADCLNKNVTKGHCEKDGNQFFVTDDGRKSL